MPHFYFHMNDQPPDTVGLLLPDVRAACHEARTAFGEIISDFGTNPGRSYTMTVQNEAGGIVLCLSMQHVETD